MFSFEGFTGTSRSQVLNPVDGNRRGELDSLLAQFLPFPTFMGCVDHDPALDEYVNMNWLLSERRAPVIVEPVLPPELIYIANHNDSVGELWRAHHELFGEYVVKHMIGGGVYEIGGAHGLASISANRIRDVPWVIHDINPTPDARYVGGIIGGAFTRESAQLSADSQTVAHSHTLEHVHDAATFIDDISHVLPLGGRQIIAWPNMRRMLERGDLNFLNLEHTAYLPVDVITSLLERKGFRILDRTNFRDHSIFLAAEKVSNANEGYRFSLSKSDALLFQNYFKMLKQRAERFNARLRAHEGPRFVFGAHVFTQMLIAAGLDQTLLDGCLDNSEAKNGKRLYGTTLHSKLPSLALPTVNTGTPLVVMAIAEYATEVKTQLATLSEGNCLLVE